MKAFATTLLLLCAALPCSAWAPNHAPNHKVAPEAASHNSRRHFLGSLVAAGSIALVAPQQAKATADARLALSDEELKQVVKEDILKRQFLVTGNLTPDIYKPTATFTDEIDTYKMDQWMKGTQKLFVGEKSDVRLVGDVNVSPEKVEFRFDEDLMFRIPLRPTVSLTGKVILTRDDSGYITSYREFWDQDVVSVLKTAKF